MLDPVSVRFRGPLLAYRSGFWNELREQGYTPLTGLNLLRLAAHVSRWLEDSGLDPCEFTSEQVDEFVVDRQGRGYTGLRTARSLRPLLSYLRALDVVPPASAPAIDDSPSGRLLDDYEGYLLKERGVEPTTASWYLGFARRLLESRTDSDLSKLTADDVTTFVLGQCRRKAGGYSRAPATAIRSLLRYLGLRGIIGQHLSGCVPTVAHWRLSSLPDTLEPEQVQTLLAACGADSVAGQRDTAIVCLLVRLGLRAGEVTSLLLDDIDWRAGELLVHGKNGWESRMPLPLDVGEALAAYLQHGRRRSERREVFLSLRAPFWPLTSKAVIAAATRALRRAGVTRGGAHLLRHTAATQLLRGGATLAQVGHVLRHRHLGTTAIYAKVDDASLRKLVRPWPGGDA